MKIARVEALHCDGGGRPWTFVRIETTTASSAGASAVTIGARTTRAR